MQIPNAYYLNQYGVKAPQAYGFDDPNYVFNATSKQQNDQFDIKVDCNLGASDRLFVKYSLPNAWTAAAPRYLFHPGLSQLAQRPREIAEIVARPDEATAYSPAWLPT